MFKLSRENLESLPRINFFNSSHIPKQVAFNNPAKKIKKMFKKMGKKYRILIPETTCHIYNLATNGHAEFFHGLNHE